MDGERMRVEDFAWGGLRAAEGEVGFKLSAGSNVEICRRSEAVRDTVHDRSSSRSSILEAHNCGAVPLEDTFIYPHGSRRICFRLLMACIALRRSR